MYELMRVNDPSKMFAEVYRKAKQKSLGLHIQQAYENIIGSEGLGEAIYDSDTSYADFGIERQFFVKNYAAIFEAVSIAGTFESYIILIKSALGADTSVTFESKAAGTLNIKIKQQSAGMGINLQPESGLGYDAVGAIVNKVDSSSGKPVNVTFGLSAQVPTNDRTILQVRSLILNILTPADILAKVEIVT